MRYADVVNDWAGQKHGLPRNLLTGIIRIESNFDPNAVGDGGHARGLGQLHPDACKQVGADFNLMFDPATAIEATAAYLEYCWKLTGDWTWALAAYNQGPTVILRGLKYAKAVEGAGT